MTKKLYLFIAIVLSLSMIGLLSSCQPKATPTPEAKELVVQTWGGAVQEAENAAFYEPFAKETGAQVIQAVGGGDAMAKLKAMVESGAVEWDVISGWALRDINRMADDGLLEPIDYSVVTNTTDLISGGKQDYAVAMEVYAVVIGYDTEAYKDNPPTSPADFFDLENFPGNRCVNNWGGPDLVFYYALLADGVARDQIWTTLQTEEGRARALKKLDIIKPVLRTYESGDEMMRLFLDKEVTMGIVLDGRMKKVNSLGGNVSLLWDGGLLDPAYWGVVKNAPNKDAAMQFINYILDPEAQSIYTQHIFYSTSNTRASEYLSEDLRMSASTYPDNLAKLHVWTFEESTLVGELLPTLLEEWNTWLSE
jgi:putative spermidine/putrescine transport system substrate-binding protein